MSRISTALCKTPQSIDLIALPITFIDLAYCHNLIVAHFTYRSPVITSKSLCSELSRGRIVALLGLFYRHPIYTVKLHYTGTAYLKGPTKIIVYSKDALVK